MLDSDCSIEENDYLAFDESKKAYKQGRWTQEEHKKFIEAMYLFGNEWKRVQEHIKSRSSTQARSHAQKFFIRLKKTFQSNENDTNAEANRRKMDSIFKWIAMNVGESCFVGKVKLIIKLD
jgi:SHAQKYF class myb-like DNA-binding protein